MPRNKTGGCISAYLQWSTLMMWAAITAVLMFTPVANAGDSEADLAKKTQNPVADLISIPFQSNMNGGIGPHNRVQNVLNVQPVIPISLNSEWNLITRTILPIVKQPDFRTPEGNTWGLSPTNFSAFLSPANSGSLLWGVGPSVQLPTTSDDQLGSRRWAAGPSAVALTIQGPWVIGAVASHVWSFTGAGGPNVNLFFSQYFINYNFDHGWYLTSAPIITGNLEAGSGNKWTVPVGGGFGKVFFIGKLPFNANCGYYANVVRPEVGGADWQVRLQIALLLPKSVFGN